jgi:hypothetical protein
MRIGEVIVRMPCSDEHDPFQFLIRSPEEEELLLPPMLVADLLRL